MKVFSPATLVALTTLVCLSTGFAQEGGRPATSSVPRSAAPAPNGTNVAVIDIAYIFKNHVRFNTQMKQLETEVVEFQAEMQAKQKALQAMKEGLKDFKVGSPDFQKHEEKLANEATQFQVIGHRHEQEFAQKEAAVYYAAYIDMQQAVALFAQQNGIGIVLKFTADEIKVEERNSVMAALARPVVYQSRLDITRAILTAVNKGQTMPATTTPAKPEQRSAKGATGTKPR